MKYVNLPNTELNASRIALGCMRIGDMTVQEIDTLINVCMESGVNIFDHADIYGGGKCEELFGEVLSSNKGLRDKIIIQSKCGIRTGYYDSSSEYILNSVDGILKRLKIDCLDILLLHRPDALAEPEDIAKAFSKLKENGKVNYFGVSNHNQMQIRLLQKYLAQPIIVNQMQFSVTNTTMISSGINVNMETDAALDRDGGVFGYCKLNDIIIQAWSPFQYGFFAGPFLGNEKFAGLNEVINKLSEKYNITNSAMAISWILRHPAGIQPVTGSTSLGRIKGICKAADITLTREEWYEVYRAAGNMIP